MGSKDHIELIFIVCFYVSVKKSIFSQVEISDVFQFFGLVLLGVGLFFWFDLGVSLSVCGAVLFLIGYFSGAFGNKK